MARPGSDGQKGFTLIELLIVVAIIGILASIAQPNFFWATQKARESVLRENLFAIRESIDQYYADKGSYPAALSDLVAGGYLRHIPTDPLTRSETTWITVPPPEEPGGVYDVKSGAPGTGRNGIPYADW
jgi:general secretion pathway protein G